MIIEKEITINKDVDSAWQLLGVQFSEAYKWASPVNHSKKQGTSSNSAGCDERACSTTMGNIKEKIISFSPENHSLSYVVSEGMPSMIKFASNNWNLTSLGKNKSKLQIKMDIQVGGLIGAIMKPMMKMQFNKMGNILVEDFKYYIENGKPHPRKVKTQNKFNN